MIPKRLVYLVCVGAMAVMLWPANAAAQRRGGGHGTPAHTTVVVRSGVGIGYGGFYRPYYYSPFYFDAYYYDPLFYNPFLWGYYPYGYAQYGRPYYRYSGNWSSARLEMKPREAQVYLDGYYVGIVDQFDGVFQRLDLPTGEHELTVYLQGYRTWRERTLFRPGESYHFKGVLEPLPAGAPAEPPPQPSPSVRNPNQNPYQPGPYRQPNDPYGRQPNDQPYGRQPNDQPYGRPYPPQAGDPGRPEPMPRPGDRNPNRVEAGYGTLSVRVQPGDATVSIDGERWDSPEGGSRLQVQLAAGQHRIEVRKDGYRTYSSTVDIRPGETQSLNVSLPNGGQ